MTPSLDPLADRVANWAEWAAEANSQSDPHCSLRGWALLEACKRRGSSAAHLAESIEGKLGRMPVEMIPQQIEFAASAWHQLISDIDREEPNLEHVRRQTPDVFFSVLEALILAEEAGDDRALAPARDLFNTIANDLYVFEPLADVAAELERHGVAEKQLSDLLCTGIAALFDGQVVARPAAAVAEPVENFRPFAELLRTGAPTSQPMTPTQLAQQLRKVGFWYVQWAAQRLQLGVFPKTRDLIVYVWEGQEAAIAKSTGLDGWEVRIGQGRDVTLATIRDGMAAVKFPKKIDPAQFVLEVRNPSAGEGWSQPFGKVELRAR